MALTTEDLVEIEKILGRNPTEVETHIFDTMWSEHCSYKSSKPVLKLLPVEGADVAVGIGEDSGIIRFQKHNGKQYCVAVSHESHNHPSQILPVEGAATGVGGVVRDVYCMGADVIGVLDSLHFGVDTTGKNPMIEEIAEEVVEGVSDYGNALGVPVLGGETIFHPSYNDNCLVNVAALGLVEEDRIIHSFVPEEAKTEPYDVILVGKSTDSTGFGGASFSSATLDREDEMTNLGAVQVHDPFLKRVIVEAIKVLLDEVNEKDIKIGFKDLGAGGISCATSEIAAAAGMGVNVYLDRVNRISEKLPVEVIACSETQERFCLAVPRDFTPRVLEIFNEQFELPNLYHQAGACQIGEVVQDPVYRLFYKGEMVCDLPVAAITTEVRAERKAESRQIEFEAHSPVVSDAQVKDAALKMLKTQNNCSKRYVYRHYDNAVRGDTVVYPGEADAVVVTPIEGCDAGLAVTIDSNLYGEIDPYICGASAVAEGIRNIIAVGAVPIAITDCLNYGNPEKPSVFYDFEQGVKGIRDAALALNLKSDAPVPVIAGNVSFYNESKQGNAVIPSPVIVVVGHMPDYKKAKRMQITAPGQTLILIGERYPEFGGSQIKAQIGSLNDQPPQQRLGDASLQNKSVYQMHQKNLISACHDISAGGLWLCLVEMILGERGHFRTGLSLAVPTDLNLATFLFSEASGYVVSVDEGSLAEAETHLSALGVDFTF
ncbi:MAG: phosphoribosylformylglycinamidine synthase II, partial [Candidatus Marinamargulisbacteria bacterium]